MPRISEFYGIVVSMYYNDHAPPHFHARYGEHEARVAIEGLHVLGGSLPLRTLDLVSEWGMIHRTELMKNWEAARRGKPLRRIPGLT